MARFKIAVLFLVVLCFCQTLFLPLALASFEITDAQESTLHKHWRKYKTKYNKLLGTPLKDFVVNEKTKKVMDKLGDALNAIEVMEKIRDKKDSEAFIKVVEELEKKGIKKLLPNFYKVLTWTSWAKAGMELFKAFAWDPMLLQEQVDTYAAHRLREMPPEEAITYVAVEFTQVQDLVKNALAAQYNVKTIYDEKGRILEKWKGKYHETLLAVMELEYNRSYAEKIQEELNRKLEEEFEAASDELLASLQAPQLTFEGTLPTDLGVLDVGEQKNLDITYTLANVSPEQQYLAAERWSLEGKLSKSHQDEKDITLGTYRFGTDLKITSDFEPGEYYLVFQVEVPELKLSLFSGRIRFTVSDYYLKMKNNLAAAKTLLLQCKSQEAAALLPSAADLERLSRLKEEDAEINRLYELALSTDQEIKAAQKALSFYYKFKAVVMNQLTACNFELVDMALQDMNKYLGQAPAACGLKGDFEALSKNVSLARAAFQAAQERLEEGKNKEADCDYEGAVKAYAEAAKISGSLSCSGARELAGQANALALEAKTKAEAKKRLARGVEEVENLIKAQERKKAQDKLNLLTREAASYQEITCFGELENQLAELQTKLQGQQGQLTVKISGKPETGLGQSVDFFSEVRLDGIPAKDPDAYNYLWEATDVKPVNAKSAQYTYRNPGKKTIRLTVTDADGRTAAAAAGLRVAHALNFTLSTDKQPVAVKEKAHLSATIEYQAEECPCTYKWTAPSVKGVITDETAWFTSPRPGTNPVTLTVTNRFGQTANATLNIEVKEFKLAVKIKGPTEIGLGQQADFLSEVTLDGVAVSDPDAYTYLWEATDATMPWKGKSVRYPYNAPGQKTIRLTVTDAGGRTATAAAALKVIPALSFTISADKSQLLTGEKVNLTSSIKGEGEQCPCSYQWSTTNHKALTGSAVWFSYPKPGAYPVSLTVKNRFRQTTAATLNVTVKERPIQKPPEAPPGAASKDLNGTWRADGYPGGAETVIIRHSGSTVTATKTKGNENVPAGEVTWHGTYSANKFTGQGRVAERGFKNPRWVTVGLTITDEDHFTISWEGQSTTRFSRIK
jgi:PKD repeat protein